MKASPPFYLLFSLSLWSIVIAQDLKTWCGKPYEQEARRLAKLDVVSSEQEGPSLTRSLSVRPQILPYTFETLGILLVDYVGVGSSAPSSSFTFRVRVENEEILNTTVHFDSESTVSVPINLADFPMRNEPYALLCSLNTLSEIDGARPVDETTATLFKVPAVNPGGSTVKVNASSRGLLVESSEADNHMIPLIPFGYYASWDGWLENNWELISDLKRSGYNIVHPVPPYGDLDIMERFMDLCGEEGLYVHYDMRHTYRQLKAVEEQVTRFRGKKALLSWYTADEPDGPSDPPEDLLAAYNLIKLLDPYHPVSIVLNCAHYNFSSYAQATDILMADVYPIANTTWSRVHNTPCNTTFGCCGCDECQGGVTDVARRLDGYSSMMRKGAKRSPIWFVGQAFGGVEHWERCPTSAELRVMTYLALIHNATGVLYWLAPAPVNLNTTTTALANEVRTFSPWLLSRNQLPVTVLKPTSMQVAAWADHDHASVLVLLVNPTMKPLAFEVDVHWDNPGAIVARTHPTPNKMSVSFSEGRINGYSEAMSTMAVHLHTPKSDIAARKLHSTPFGLVWKMEL